MHIILGIDAGNHYVKVAGERSLMKFRSNICEWFERDIEEQFGDDDMEFTINNRRGYAGSIAMFEDEFGDGTRYGNTKAHDDAYTRILLAIHRYVSYFEHEATHISLVTGQPISRHKQDEKDTIIRSLVGHHTIDVNHMPYNITISNVAVAPEGSAAFWSILHSVTGTVRILDIGSGTINAATIHDSRHINKESDTFNFGMETISNQDHEKIATGIVRNITKLRWQQNDKVYVCGGAAEDLVPYIQNSFPNATLMENHLYANALGFYRLAQGAFL